MTVTSESQPKRMDTVFRKRIRQRLYYGDMANLDSPSLPLTELAVEYFRDSVSEKLGHVDMDMASNMIKRSSVSPCSMVLSVLYAKRLRQRGKEFLCTMSSSDVFFISMMMASKYLYDEGVDEEVFNDEWADNTDQEVADVNQLEMDFLQAMDWHLFIRPEDFEDALAAIERRLALQEGLKRGWFTYSELAVLGDSNLLANLWTQLGLECSKLLTVLSAAYVASLVSMVGSTALAMHISGPLSSAAVAFLTFQSSPFALTNSNDSASFGHVISVSNEFSESSTLKEPMFDLSFTDLEDALNAAAVADVGDSSFRNGSGDNGLETNDVATPHNIGKGGSHWVPHQKNDGCDQDPDPDPSEDSSTRSTSSLWSLLFLDSLLSQLWALASPRSQSVGVPLPETPNSACNGGEVPQETTGHRSQRSTWKQKSCHHCRLCHNGPHNGNHKSKSPVTMPAAKDQDSESTDLASSWIVDPSQEQWDPTKTPVFPCTSSKTFLLKPEFAHENCRCLTNRLHSALELLTLNSHSYINHCIMCVNDGTPSPDLKHTSKILNHIPSLINRPLSENDPHLDPTLLSTFLPTDTNLKVTDAFSTRGLPPTVQVT